MRPPFAQLREWLAFWVSDRPGVACCQFVDDEVLETDGAEYDCATCPVAERLAALDADNRRAWSLSGTVCSRFTFDGHCVGEVLGRLTSDLAADDYGDLVQRLGLIYAELNPVPVKQE